MGDPQIKWHTFKTNTATLLLLKINACSFPLQCSGIMKAPQGSPGAGRLASPGTEGAGHHPSWETGLAPPELSEHSCLAVLCTVIFFSLEVYFKVWIRFYGVWLSVIRSNKLQFCFFAEAKFTAVPGTMILQSYFSTRSRACRTKLRVTKAVNWAEGLVDWAPMTLITWHKNLRQNWDSGKQGFAHFWELSQNIRFLIKSVLRSQ